MIQKRSHHVTKGAYDSFLFTILRGGVWAIESEFDPVGSKKGVELLVIEPTPVVTLKGFNGQVELIFGHLEKLDKVGEDL